MSDGETSVRRRRGRPWNPDGNTEERILEAARVCFAESGYAGASTHAVAAAAALTTGVLYHYFAGNAICTWRGLRGRMTPLIGPQRSGPGGPNLIFTYVLGRATAHTTAS